MLRSAVAVAAASAVLLGVSSSGSAQAVASSTGPDSVEVTVYRDPARGADHPLRLDWLDGYALITERRRLKVPAGPGVVRFEAVASGILPQSAIITGVPDGIIEKNQDAQLLSPATLLDRSLGARVRLRRTDLATGRAREETAEVLTGAEGAVVLRTAAGTEALRCSGLPETIVYERVPSDLSAKPTLSVRTRAERSVDAVVTLSYLAAGFDWQANYVAELSPDAQRVDLFAWMTLASNDDTSFADAEAQAVAGKPNREGERRASPAHGGSLLLRCWPNQRTSDVAEVVAVDAYDISEVPAPPPPAPPAVAEAIVVTGARVRQAELEQLGDFKLYRLPERVTVAANGQKQVALLRQPAVSVELLYRSNLNRVADGYHRPDLLLRTRNRSNEGLGMPLPAGSFALFERIGGKERPSRRILLGEGSTDDRAVGEDVEIAFAERGGTVLAEIEQGGSEGEGSHVLRVRNAAPRSVVYEAEGHGLRMVDEGRGRATQRSGKLVWRVTLAPGGEAVLRYANDGD